MTINEEYKFLKENNRLSYRNNPKSLFRKYAKLVTWIANTQLGRDYLGISNNLYKFDLMLPNGFREENQGIKRTTIYTSAKFSPKLYPLLQVIDFMVKVKNLDLIRDKDEVKSLVSWVIGSESNRVPALAKMALPTMGVILGVPLTPLTITTVYPDADPETTSVDGYVARRPAGGESWATIHDATVGDGNTDSSTGDTSIPQIVDNGSAWTRLQRGFFLFDTSSLPDTDTISAATFDLYSLAAADNNHSQSADLVLSTPASNTNLVDEDYDQVGTTLQATARSFSVWTAAAYQSLTLNATGLGNISKTGITKFGLRASSDTSNIEPTKVTASSRINAQLAELSGTSTDPKLVITHAGSSPSSSVSPSPSSSISPSPSLSVSSSVSPSPSSSVSPSPSSSVSLSPSSSLSPSPSLTPSASISPSPSTSISLSPSSSQSPSSSISLSPSSTPSLSASKSASRSPSKSQSPSHSASTSPSVSRSASPSVSASTSYSLSPSVSDSPSPSAPESLYTREVKASLPSSKADLTTIYTTKEEQDVYLDDSIYVPLEGGSTNYLIHQFKKLNSNRSDWIKVRVDLKSSLAPTSAPVYLQVWNGVTNAWETYDSDNEKLADTNFSLYAVITEDAFRDGSWYDFNNEFACRVYQQNNGTTKILSVDLVQISFVIPYENKYNSTETNYTDKYSTGPNITYTPKYPSKNPQDDN